jgi:threonine synthase
VSGPLSTIACAGCGAAAEPSDPYPFRCRNAGRDDDVDHVLVRTLDPAQVRFPAGADGEPNPFLRYRSLLNSFHRATAAGMTDDAFCQLVRDLDQQVAAVDGHGFGITPFQRNEGLGAKLGFREPGGLWIKNETGNVAGSHKARHLMGVLLHLAVAEQLGLTDPADRRDLAIASCGNAALAAAVLARAGNWRLRVFVPVDAEAGIVRRLTQLGADVVACGRRPDQAGDPTYHRLLRELSAGVIPFTCQGNLNGLAIEGGETLGYELVTELGAAGLSLDHLVVQVGGGALATSCIRAFDEAVALGAAPTGPAVHTVQTEGAHPLERAFHLVRAELPADPTAADVRACVAGAARHRSGYMWPWEDEPKSLATGILDDETYDWRAVVEGMLRSGGRPLVVSEDQIAAAHTLGRQAGYRVDPTGTAGLAGVLKLRASGVVAPTDRVAVLFTGVER